MAGPTTHIGRIRCSDGRNDHDHGANPHEMLNSMRVFGTKVDEEGSDALYQTLWGFPSCQNIDTGYCREPFPRWRGSRTTTYKTEGSNIGNLLTPNIGRRSEVILAEDTE